MDVLGIMAGLTLLALGLLWLAARRSITICVLDVVDGQASVVQGGIAPRVLADVRDVVRKPAISKAQLRIVRVRDHARVEVSGHIADHQVQQLRNVVGTVPLAKLINAPTH